nr:hypothetical protein [Tanacetum cinerariifolium]
MKPKIGNDVEFEINSNFMRELRRKLFKGTDDEDVHEHVRRVLEITNLFHFPGVTHDVVMLRVLPITLNGPALRWKNRLLAGSITTWDLREKAFIKQYCPPFKIAKKLEEIHNFEQGMDKPLHHGCTEPRAVEQDMYIGSSKETIIKYYEESIKKRTAHDEWIWNFIKNMDLNLRALDTTTHNLHVKADQLTQMVLTNAKDIIMKKTKMVKKDMKEPVPRDLPVVHPYVPPTPFLGRLQEQKGNHFKNRKNVCMIYKRKLMSRKGKWMMVRTLRPLGLVCDKAKVIREEEHDYDIPLHDGVMQPLTPKTIHITQPDDDYVESATNLILDKHLNKCRKELFDMTEFNKN